MNRQHWQLSSTQQWATLSIMSPARCKAFWSQLTLRPPGWQRKTEYRCFFLDRCFQTLCLEIRGFPLPLTSDRWRPAEMAELLEPWSPSLVLLSSLSCSVGSSGDSPGSIRLHLVYVSMEATELLRSFSSASESWRNFSSCRYLRGFRQVCVFSSWVQSVESITVGHQLRCRHICTKIKRNGGTLERAKSLNTRVNANFSISVGGAESTIQFSLYYSGGLLSLREYWWETI